jgi:transcriptional regulator with XRE-family HTH domain
MPNRLAGLRLRQTRKLCGFTQEALAAVLNRDAPAENVTVAVVKNLESGRTTMSVRRLLVLAEALHVAPVALLEDAGRAGKAGQADNGLEIIPVRSGGFS